MSTPATPASSRIERIAQLHRARQKSWFLRISLLLLIGLMLWSWTAGDLYESYLTPEQKRANLDRFIDKMTPAPVRDSGDWSLALPWAGEQLGQGKGIEAALRTFALATVAATLSGLFALAFLPGASRNLATSHPLDISGGSGRTSRWFWRICNKLTRALFVFTRSLPEYVLGFLLISIFGPDPWALVLALAIHNFGILGRLGAEVIENAPQEPAQTVIVHGGGRIGAYLAALLPESFNRMVVYFFYRWETCVREATVLGMLGVISLGYLVVAAKSGRAFDQMVFFVLLGGAIVLIGDLISGLVRRWLRFERV
ncbi:MAG: phosphonate transport system permease protein [Verrucomicrobiales bacterium]|jgi:phosphonate transport system permease protein